MNSKKKHNIQYIKPAEPAFLTRLKEQAGYIEGPNVDTKKEQRPEMLDEDGEDRDDEKPVVVVMNEGDLTEEEANLHVQAQKAVEGIVEKADLSQRVIFKRKKNDETSSTESSNPKEVKKKKSSKSQKPQKTILSFNDEEDE